MPTLVTTVLIASPFLLGLNRPLAWSLVCALLLLACLRHPGAFIPVLRRPAKFALPLVLAGVALFAFGLPLLQALGGTCVSLPAAAPCLVDGEQALLSAVFALMAMLWLLLLCGPARPTPNQVLVALTLAGSVQALYALATHFLGITPWLLAGVQHHEGVPLGGFPNRNHLAAFLCVTIFAAVALILRTPAGTGTGRAGRWRVLLDKRLLWRLCIVVMVIALIATRSRAGNAVFIIGLLAGLAWLLLAARRRAASSTPVPDWRFVLLLIASVLVVDAVLIGSFVGIDRLQQRIADTSLQGEQRDDVYDALLAHPDVMATPLGHGAASFLRVFEPMKPAGLPLLYDQAHNDYLQVLVERGWLGAALLLMTLLGALWLSLSPRFVGDAAVRFALVAATVALALQASVEFVGQIPVLWLAWLALLATAMSEPLADATDAAPSADRSTRRRRRSAKRSSPP